VKPIVPVAAVLELGSSFNAKVLQVEISWVTANKRAGRRMIQQSPDSVA
jgi:hypothetical protein